MSAIPSHIGADMAGDIPANLSGNPGDKFSDKFSWAAEATDRMNRMYRRQRHIYDGTRRYYLLGRDQLIANLKPEAGANVLEVGCGTGRNLVLAPRRFPEATVVRLVRDYRSTPQVVELANRVLDAGGSSAASRARVALVGQRPPGPQPAFLGSPSEPEEAAEVAVRIQALLDAGTPASEIAVLYRMHQSACEANRNVAIGFGISRCERDGRASGSVTIRNDNSRAGPSASRAIHRTPICLH